MNESKSKVREGNDQEVDSRSSSFEDTRLTNGGNGLLGNGLARQSQADLPAVSSPNVNSPDVEGERTLPLRSGGGGLQAKSGIIIVRFTFSLLIPSYPVSREANVFSLTPSTFFRVFIICSS